MSGRAAKSVKNRWQACAFVLLSKFSACLSAPPLTAKIPTQSPFSAWTCILTLLLVFYCGIIVFLVVPPVVSQIKGHRQDQADDETRFKQLKAVATYFHGGNTYAASIAKAQKQFSHQKWGVSATKLSQVVSDFKAANEDKAPNRFSLQYFLDAIEKKTMGRGDGLNEQQLKDAKAMFSERHRCWKALPNWSDWNAILVEVKFGGRNSFFQFSPEFLRTSALRCDVKPIKCSSVNASRVLAVGDYRNHIGCAASWIACTKFHGVAKECIYSLDDTSLLLEPSFSREVTGLASVEQISAARKSNIGLSVMASEKDVKTNCKVLKVLVLTSGGGQCPVKVIKIRDSKIQQDELINISETPTTAVWIHFVPADVDDEDSESASEKNVRYASKIFKACVIPAIQKDMARLVQGPKGYTKVDDEGKELPNSQPLSQSTRSALQAQRKAKFARAILTFDGDWPQLQALIDSRSADGECFAPLAHEFQEAGIELFKWAGGCSGIQQPLDRGRSFFCLKSALKGGARTKFNYRNVKDISSLPDYCTDEFEKKAKRILGVSKKGNSDWNTYWKFICNFEDLAAYAFRKDLIVQSFCITGLAPFSLKLILKSYCFYDSLMRYAPDAIALIEAALPELVEEASRTGYVLDESIDRLLWPLFCRVADERYMKRKTPDMPVNHRRCIWLSNAAWLSAEYSRIKAVEAKKAADDAAKELKKANALKRKREAADRVIANAAKRNKPFDADTWQPDRDWPAKGEAFVPCSYDDVICACSKRTKVAHLKSEEHSAWLARIRPLEQQKQAPLVPIRQPPVSEDDEDSDASDSSNDSAAPGHNAEGNDAVNEALERREDVADEAGIYSHRTDAHDAVLSEAAEQDAAGDAGAAAEAPAH
jgi:hypothetical protein